MSAARAKTPGSAEATDVSGTAQVIVGVVSMSDAGTMTRSDPAAIDLAAARADTPGCLQSAFLDSAGSSLSPRPVVDTVVDHLRLEAEIGGYRAAEQNVEALEQTYEALAALLHCGPDEVALLDSSTRAWAQAFYSLTFRSGDRILTSRVEYASNYLAYLQVAQRTGAVIEVVPDAETGELSVTALEAMLDDRVRLVAVTHVPMNGGLVNPAEEIGRVTSAAGVPFLLDACQSVGQVVLDVDRLGVDMLAGNGRKWLRGPRGTGFLFVRRSLCERLHPPMIDLHSAEWVAPGRYELRPDSRRFEMWESSVACRLGLGRAVRYALDLGMEAIEAAVMARAQALRDALAGVDGATVRDLGRRRCGIVSFTIDGYSADEVREHLARAGVTVTVGRASSTLLDMSHRSLSSIVRASPHYFNDEADLHRLVESVALLARGRS
jgi:cysteine desulfurase / selenocysteine lyase